MTQDKEELQPCPLCLSKAFWGCDGVNPNMTFHVSCENLNCGCCVQDFDRKEEAFEAWNTRPAERVEDRHNIIKDVLFKENMPITEAIELSYKINRALESAWEARKS